VVAKQRRSGAAPLPANMNSSRCVKAHKRETRRSDSMKVAEELPKRKSGSKLLRSKEKAAALLPLS